MPPPSRPILLLTRPEAAARRFAVAVAQTAPDLAVVIAPLMRIVPVAHDEAALRAAPVVVLTSIEAVPACGPGAGRLALCVGEGTAAAAEAAGFAVRTGATGEGHGLLPLIAACDKPMIHARGRHRAVVLPVPDMVVYDQQSVPLPEAGRTVLMGDAPVILPLFSPRSALLAAAACAGARAPLYPLAISQAAVDAWGGDEAMPYAPRPNAASLMSLIESVHAQLVEGEQRLRKPG